MATQTFLRWKLVDPYDKTLANTYVFALNPHTMNSPHPSRNITARSTTAINGRTLMIEGQRQPAEFTFSGDFLEANHYEALRSWVLDRTGRKVFLYDHFGRKMTVVFTRFNDAPKRVIARYWRHTYDITCYVLDIEGPTFRVDPPYVPREVKAVGGYETATITWQPPLSARGSAILHYVITDTASPSVQKTVKAAEELKATFHSLSPGYRTFSVTAVSTAGESQPALAGVQVNAVTGPFGIVITSLATTYDTAIIKWSAPTDNGGAHLSGFVVSCAETSTASTRGEGTWSLPADARTYTFTGLAPYGNTYDFKVAGVNSRSLQGPWAIKTGKTLVATGPSAPVITSLVATAFSLRMQWSPPVRDGGLPISSYNVVLESFVGGDNGDAYVQGLPAGTRAHTFTRLRPGVTYRASVYAVNATNVTSAGQSGVNIKTITTVKG